MARMMPWTVSFVVTDYSVMICGCIDEVTKVQKVFGNIGRADVV